MARIFDTLLARASNADIKSGQAGALDWFRNEAGKFRAIDRAGLLREQQSMLVPMLNVKSIGKMYMFFYDPKHKDTLPYYDKFPLVFPFKMETDGFYGLNLHYISPILRAKLMDAFYDILNNNKYDETTRIRMSYSILEASAKYKYFKPCVKRYLSSHVMSKYLFVDPTKWNAALFLPTEQFAKSSKKNVWLDSSKAIYGR
jgi:hypothetical protein